MELIVNSGKIQALLAAEMGSLSNPKPSIRKSESSMNPAGAPLHAPLD
jgi:hypothetical protein